MPLVNHANFSRIINYDLLFDNFETRFSGIRSIMASLHLFIKSYLRLNFDWILLAVIKDSCNNESDYDRDEDATKDYSYNWKITISFCLLVGNIGLGFEIYRFCRDGWFRNKVFWICYRTFIDRQNNCILVVVIRSFIKFFLLIFTWFRFFNGTIICILIFFI